MASMSSNIACYTTPGLVHLINYISNHLIRPRNIHGNPENSLKKRQPRLRCFGAHLLNRRLPHQGPALDNTQGKETSFVFLPSNLPPPPPTQEAGRLKFNVLVTWSKELKPGASQQQLLFNRQRESHKPSSHLGR